MKALLVLFSYHHNNTAKIANAIAEVLGAQIKTPQEINPEELQEYDILGFGSGIYGEKFHKTVLSLADRLPQITDKSAFVFSTNGAPASLFRGSMEREQLVRNHRLIKEKLQAKGYTIVGEFSCPGWNTNSFLKYTGGINKGRPNAEDLRRAEEFALGLKQKPEEM
jgi:flavodoxin